ncbi:MAG: hypothetical protein ACTSRG_23940 [Candidatus Helarchaeota archaeon]
MSNSLFITYIDNTNDTFEGWDKIYFLNDIIKVVFENKKIVIPLYNIKKFRYTENK